MIRTEVGSGKIYYMLEKEIEYVNKGQTDMAKELVLHEPVKDSSVECIELSAIIQKAQGSSVRAIFGDEAMSKKGKEEEEEAVGEEVVPFHERKEINNSEIIKDVQGTSQIILMSGNIKSFLKSGKELLTRKRQSNETKCLLKVVDERGTHVTPEIFKDMGINDQVFVICLYYCFFGLSSIGQRKTTSSEEQE